MYYRYVYIYYFIHNYDDIYNNKFTKLEEQKKGSLNWLPLYFF